MKKDSRIDNYIEKSPAFSKPILIHFRKLVHENCPGVEETVKWGCPHFDYNGIMCAVAAFKEHCAINFWKAALMKDFEKMNKTGDKSAGNFGKLLSLKDLPSDKILSGYIKEAMKLNDENIKVERKKVVEKKEVIIPAELLSALAKNKTAKTFFENFSEAKKREYAEWIHEAKTENTKSERIKISVEWIGEGKSRNWKYQKK